MTHPPADGEPAPGAFPYGPASEPTGADREPTMAETFAAIDAEFEPDQASRRVEGTIRTVKTLSLVAVIGGALALFAAVLQRDDGKASGTTLVLVSIILLMLVCAAPTGLLFLGRRHRHREVTRSAARSATVWGIVLLGLGLLIVGPTLVTTATAEIRDALARTRPLSAAETEYSPADLAIEYQTLVDSAAAAGEGVPKAGSEPLVHDYLCELGNLDLGLELSGTNYYLTALSAEDALDAIEAAWNEAGYVTQRYAEGEYPVTDYEDPDYIDHDDPMVTTEGGPFTWASAYVFDGYDADGQLRLYVDYETICVAR